MTNCKVRPMPQSAARASVAVAIKSTKRRSGNKSMVGVLRYQCPSNMAAIVNPSNRPDSGVVSPSNRLEISDRSTESETGPCVRQPPISPTLATT